MELYILYHIFWIKAKGKSIQIFSTFDYFSHEKFNNFPFLHFFYILFSTDSDCKLLILFNKFMFLLLLCIILIEKKIHKHY